MKSFKFLIPALSLLVVACHTNNKPDHTETPKVVDNKYALAYQLDDKIVAANADTSKQISFGGATDPSVSPDGNKLAYTVSDSLGNRSVWIADMLSKSQTKLNVKNKNYYRAMWSPSGDRVAFSIFNKKSVWKVGVIKVDNSGYVMLDSTSVLNFYAPAWKNENQLIAQDLQKLYTFDLTGKIVGAVNIVDLIGKNFSIASSNTFFYSKDGKKLIFNAGNQDILAGLTGPAEAVYVLDMATKKVKRISPDGVTVPSLFVTANDKIVYSGMEKPFTTSKIYATDLEGRDIKVVVDKGNNPSAN
ncbi:Tol biopolymer transport system component [Pedobacter cryoconitis]|uniref:Tol biopolymer transport system component n=1 Tax=Pedobacter cryoconitis TaxID=188932 RepID=A0A7W9DXI4_9SPHI|nr:PD40 domain-containing protein [Pedobacter cryoconitis]MBB5634943.1 Tol biopolymer transport system component [Pedobacter cryoconitis]MBB6271924.1 Tol biopolymer transport system component [Pedobacter cryoconitis]